MTTGNGGRGSPGAPPDTGNGAHRRVASPETQAAYLSEGLRHLRRAREHYPDADAADAVLMMLETDRSTLMAATVRLYTRQIEAVLRELAGEAQLDVVGPQMERARDALRARRGTPLVPRTASKKAKDVTREEALSVFRVLKARALLNRDMTAAAAAIFTLVVPRLGVRPVELVNAVVRGTKLTVHTAKATSRHHRTRGISLAPLQPEITAATRALVLLAARAAETQTYKHWIKALAEALARGCAEAGVRRLAPYSFRHVAIATWTKGGFSASEIALLVGHLGVDSARRHYAGGQHGWEVDMPIQPDVASEITHVAEKVDAYDQIQVGKLPATRADSMGSPIVEVEEFPIPQPQRPLTDLQEQARLLQKMQADQDRIWDRVEASVSNLRNAQSGYKKS